MGPLTLVVRAAGDQDGAQVSLAKNQDAVGGFGSGGQLMGPAPSPAGTWTRWPHTGRKSAPKVLLLGRRDTDGHLEPSVSSGNAP
jgi:hypothetical protein